MNEQIEEMAKVMMEHCEIDNQCGSCHWSTCNECLAEVLYNASYRKQSEGEWIPTYTYTPEGTGIYKCSLCGRKSANPKADNFCPNCGADMKAVRNERR